MNDVSAIAGQLSKLRERLDQKELELGVLAEQTDAERICAIQFITRLTHQGESMSVYYFTNSSFLTHVE